MIKAILPITLAISVSSFSINNKDINPSIPQDGEYVECFDCFKINNSFNDFKNEISEKKEEIKDYVEKNTIKLEEIDVLYSSSVKSYMDANKITNKSSKQYKYIHSDNVKIDDRGHYYEEYKGEKFYAVALGSYFGDIGNRFVFELSSGNKVYVIKLDEKSDNHTNDGYIHKKDNSVIEFIINENLAKDFYPHNNGYMNNGNFNNYEDFNGNIEKIYYAK